MYNIVRYMTGRSLAEDPVAKPFMTTQCPALYFAYFKRSVEDFQDTSQFYIYILVKKNCICVTLLHIDLSLAKDPVATSFSITLCPALSAWPLPIAIATLIFCIF